MKWLDFAIFGNGKGLAAPYFDQTFHWLVDARTYRGAFYTFSAGYGAQLTSFQWTVPRPQERRRLAGMEFAPFRAHRRLGRVETKWAVQLPHRLEARHFELIRARLGDSGATVAPWGTFRGEQEDAT